MRKYLLLLLFFWFFYPIDVVRVVDGDTLIANIDLGFNINWKDTRIRLIGCDAYDYPHEKAEDATNLFKEFLTHEPIILITQGKTDNWGRVLGYLENSKKQLAHEVLIDAELTTNRFRSSFVPPIIELR